MACRYGSQFFFWFTEASVEITPKLISVGACAPTVKLVMPIAAAGTAHVHAARIMGYPPMVMRSLPERDRRPRSGGQVAVRRQSSLGGAACDPAVDVRGIRRRCGALCVLPLARGLDAVRKQLADLGAIDAAEQRGRQHGGWPV